MIITESDKKWLQSAMRYFKLPKLGIAYDPSTKKYPDIWVDQKNGYPVITVTNEWLRQNTAERRKRLTHELIHAGWGYRDNIEELGYYSHPEKDVFSRVVYETIR